MSLAWIKQNNTKDAGVIHVSLVLSTLCVSSATPPQKSLLVSTISGIFLVALGLVARVRASQPRDPNHHTYNVAYAAVLYGLFQLCTRATWSTANLRWSYVLLPLTTLILRSNVDIGSLSNFAPPQQRTTAYILLACVSGWTALGSPTPYLTTCALGLCCTALLSQLLRHLYDISKSGDHFDDAYLVEKATLVYRNGLNPDHVSVFGTVSAVFCGLSATSFERLPESMLDGGSIWIRCFVAAVAQSVQIWALFQLVALSEPIEASTCLNAAALCAHIFLQPSLTAFAMSAGSVTLLVCRNQRTLTQRYCCNLAVVLVLAFYILAGVFDFTGRYHQALYKFKENIALSMPQTPNASLNAELADHHIHPVAQLVHTADSQWQLLLARQSTSLGQAAREYEKRYKLHPPPLFDAWLEFAQSRNVILTDEFDMIHHTLLPFWSFKPEAIRKRVQQAIGYEENGLIAFMIRDGRVATLEGGEQWQRDALRGLTSSFVHLLPDMDLAFNMHDEPRIVVPHDELSQMVTRAREEVLPSALANLSPQNGFSAAPTDLKAKLADAQTSRFNEYAHQNTWVPSRLSCAPESPARDFSESMPDNAATYAVTQLGFVYNLTASMDVCSIPSLRRTHGFFDRPNAFKVAHELIPIFTESKVSSFQDILFPSMWHWNRAIHLNRTSDMHLPGHSKPMYTEDADMDWDQKNNTLWWRGSTTGGYSRDGGWRRQHRQRIVQAFGSPNLAKILARNHGSGDGQWEVGLTRRRDYSDLIDVHFTGVGQCDPGDCRAQEEYFDLRPHAEFEDAWANKHLLDMDGNAFSARFYALLQSKSLVYKMAVFQEWHHDWIQPWLHYVPMSLAGDEHLEVVRYLAQDPEGMTLAPRLAGSGREWAMKSLRREDMEAWMFRLLLEYARLVDDNRLNIGYAG